MNSDVDPESIGHIRAEDSREEKPDDSLISRRQTTYLIILFDVLFAIVLFIVFLIFLTAADDEGQVFVQLGDDLRQINQFYDKNINKYPSLVRLPLYTT